MIDLSHDNSGKDPARQPDVARAVAEQVAGGDRHDQRRNDRVVPDRRPPGSRTLETLVYGQSITDGCIGWETTVEVLDDLAEAVRARRTAG